MKSILALAALLTLGCNTLHETSAGSTTDIAKYIRYFRDPRAGQCFAYIEQQNGSTFSSVFQITWVPCSPEVIKLIPDGSR